MFVVFRTGCDEHSHGFFHIQPDITLKWYFLQTILKGVVLKQFSKSPHKYCKMTLGRKF